MVRRSLFSRLFSRFTGSRAATSVNSPAILVGQPMVAAAGAGVVGGASQSLRDDRPAIENPMGRAEMSDSNGTAPAAGTKATPGEPKQGPIPVDVEPVVVPPAGPESAPKEASNGRKEKTKDVKPSRMAPQEELSLKITEGLSTLSGLLNQIDGKLAVQNEHSETQAGHNKDLQEHLRALPVVLGSMAETQQASLEVVRDVRTTMQEQVEVSRRQADTLEKLPAVVESVGARIDAQNETGLQVRESVEGVGKSVRSLADGAQRAQNTMLAEFRRAQDEHRRRLEELVDRERKTILVVSGLALLVVVCLVLILVNQTGG